MKFVILLVIPVLLFLTASSQRRPVQGKITDDKSIPIQGATIHVLNTNISVITDKNGLYSIPLTAKGDNTLEISSIGFATLTVQITGNDNLPQIHMIPASRQLSEVVISAQKKEENQQKVPFAVTTISAKQIDDERLWANKDMTGLSPNLYIANPGDGRDITTLRGITSSSYDPAVVTYIDGVSQFTLDTYIPQLFDVERIEILKGPQSTLYGRNALGGVINIITKQPTDRTETSVSLSAGNYGLQRYSLSLRTPIIKGKLYIGAAGLYEGLNGYYTNDYNNSHFDKQHRLAGNYYLRYLPGPHWSMTLNLKNMANRNNGAFPLTATAAQALANPFHVDQNAVAEMIDNTLQTSLSVIHSGTSVNFSSQTSYQSNYRYYNAPLDGDFSPADAITIINNYGKKSNKVQVITQEFKLNSVPPIHSPFQWTAGAYLFYQDVPNKQATHFGADAQLVGSPDTGYSVITTSTEKNIGASGYGQATLTIARQFFLSAGLRFDYQNSWEQVQGAYQGSGSSAPVQTTRPDTSATASYNAISPMASLMYMVTNQMNLYFSYHQGYRTGGLTQISTDPTQPPLYSYKPEYSSGLEFGSKANFFNKRLTGDISLFYTIINDVQVPTLVLPQAITITKNAGRLVSKGLDFSFIALIATGFEADFGFGYTNSIYTTLNLSENGSMENLSGNRQIFTPDFSSRLALQYQLPLNAHHTASLQIRGEWLYIGKQYFDLANTISQADYSLGNASVGVNWKNLTLTAWVRNLTNQTYIAYAYDFGATHLGDPRNYGLTVKVQL